MDGRKIAIGAGAVAGVAAVAGAAAIFARKRGDGEGHAADDLTGDERPAADARAPEAFRPDPTAIPTAAEREALRPATGHAPGFAADRGTTVTEPVEAA